MKNKWGLAFDFFLTIHGLSEMPMYKSYLGGGRPRRPHPHTAPGRGGGGGRGGEWRSGSSEGCVLGGGGGRRNLNGQNKQHRENEYF